MLWSERGVPSGVDFFLLDASSTMTDEHGADGPEVPRHHSQGRDDYPPSRPQSQHPKIANAGTWLAAEDSRLRAAVARYGTRWVSVASEVGTRSGDQCGKCDTLAICEMASRLILHHAAKRWNENLNPELVHDPWTTEEVSPVLFQERRSRALLCKLIYMKEPPSRVTRLTTVCMSKVLSCIIPCFMLKGPCMQNA